MVISFLDNAWDDTERVEPTADSSSLLVVSLDLVEMNATINIQHLRPDGGYSQAKGNVQYLSNGNILAGWGENAYITEYSKPGAELVYEAQFASPRFANYRAYKMHFGNTSKTGFETSFLVGGYHPIIYAEALDNYWNSLGNSSLEVTQLPLGFHDTNAPFIPQLQQAKLGKKHAMP